MKYILTKFINIKININEFLYKVLEFIKNPSNEKIESKKLNNMFKEFSLERGHISEEEGEEEYVFEEEGEEEYVSEEEGEEEYVSEEEEEGEEEYVSEEEGEEEYVSEEEEEGEEEYISEEEGEEEYVSESEYEIEYDKIEKDIYKLELNESWTIDCWHITKVPGGWIYRYCADNNNGPAVFVPFKYPEKTNSSL